MEKQRSSQIKEDKFVKLLTEDKGKTQDPCKVCGSELYFDDIASKRAGILNSHDKVVGWLCPYCKTEFDDEDNIIVLLSSIHTQGET